MAFTDVQPFSSWAWTTSSLLFNSLPSWDSGMYFYPFWSDKTETISWYWKGQAGEISQVTKSHLSLPAMPALAGSRSTRNSLPKDVVPEGSSETVKAVVWRDGWPAWLIGKRADDRNKLHWQIGSACIRSWSGKFKIRTSWRFPWEEEKTHWAQ